MLCNLSCILDVDRACSAALRLKRRGVDALKQNPKLAIRDTD
jgi:hypothetical protein